MSDTPQIPPVDPDGQHKRKLAHMCATTPRPEPECPYWSDGQHCYSEAPWKEESDGYYSRAHDDKECRCGAEVKPR